VVEVVVDVVVDVVVEEVEVVVDDVVVRGDVVVVAPRRRSGRANAATSPAGDEATSCTASQRAAAPETCPHASCVVQTCRLMGAGGVPCGAAPPAVPSNATVATADSTATPVTHNFRVRDRDILNHPTQRVTGPSLSDAVSGS
jgi:hypothetical protein